LVPVVLAEPQVLIPVQKVAIQSSPQLPQQVGDMEQEVLATLPVEREVPVAVEF
jgi:hypothetical protein